MSTSTTPKKTSGEKAASVALMVSLIGISVALTTLTDLHMVLRWVIALVSSMIIAFIVRRVVAATGPKNPPRTGTSQRTGHPHQPDQQGSHLQ